MYTHTVPAPSLEKEEGDTNHLRYGSVVKHQHTKSSACYNNYLCAQGRKTDTHE